MRRGEEGQRRGETGIGGERKGKEEGRERASRDENGQPAEEGRSGEVET